MLFFVLWKNQFLAFDPYLPNEAPVFLYFCDKEHSLSPDVENFY